MTVHDAYLLGWLAYDGGGSYAAQLRRFRQRVGGEHLVDSWVDGWDDNFHARGCGAAKLEVTV